MKKVIVIGSINIDNVMYTNNMPIPGMTVYGVSVPVPAPDGHVDAP